jgi:transaldolase
MALYLDSAEVEEVRQAMALGFVAGITTNPILIARTGRPAQEVIADLCGLCPGEVFYQLTERTPEAMEAEARRFHALSPEQVVLKVPCDLRGLSLVTRISPEMPCALTAVFSAAQAYLAGEAGARYVIPYVNRATKLCGDGLALVSQMVEVLRRTGRGTEILAASLKSPTEVVAALTHGAHHVTVPLAVILEMAEHRLSTLAIEEFANVGLAQRIE